MIEHDDHIWCNVHDTIHEKTTDPYDSGYELTGETPECGPADWCRLWIGARIEESEVNDDL